MIPNEIAKLVDLAINDSLITPKERGVILEEALKMGVPIDEANKYIDDKLAERLSAAPKDSLKHCPHCGAQIPLVSSSCPFCGQVITSEHDVQVYSAEGGTQALRIINDENKRIQAERSDLKNCPDCGAPFPLVGNICCNCGHVLHQYEGADLNIDRLIQLLKENFAMIGKPKTHYEGLHGCERYIRLIETIYGSHPEARKIIDEYKPKIADINNQDYYRNNPKLAYPIIALVISLLLVFGVSQSCKKRTAKEKAGIENVQPVNNTQNGDK